MKKRIIYGVLAVLLAFTLVLVVGYKENVISSKADEGTEEYDETDYEVNPEDNIGPEDIESDIVPSEEDDEAMRELYNNIPVEQLEKFRAMTDEEVEEREIEIMSGYEVGQEFSEEDANFMLFVRYEYNVREISRGWKTKKHKIKNSKTACGVTASYDGYLETWDGGMHCQYGANVKCTLSKAVKSAKFKVHHALYGILGWSGKIPTIGVTYNDTLSSSSYKKSFKFNKFKKYTAVWTVYLSTWGELAVVTDKGEFNVRSKTYKHIV